MLDDNKDKFSIIEKNVLSCVIAIFESINDDKIKFDICKKVDITPKQLIFTLSEIKSRLK